jgi:hypothetical protein
METMQFYRPVTIEPILDEGSSVPEFASSSLSNVVLALGLVGTVISIGILSKIHAKTRRNPDNKRQDRMA